MNITNQQKQIICSYFKNKNLSSSLFRSYIKKYNDLNALCTEIFKLNKEYESPFRMVKCILNNIELKRCEQCGKLLTYSQCITHNNIFCCYQCSADNLNRKQKVQNTFLTKYNGTSSFTSKIILDKINKTNIQKYGIDNPFKLKSFQQKAKQTKIEKYGEDFNNNKLIKEKRQQTNLNRFGVTCTLLNENVQQKRKQTLLKKYNSDKNYSKLLLEQRKKTCLLKYGCENPNLIKTYLHFNRFKDYIIPMFTKEQYKGYNHIYKWKCVKCGNEFEQRIYPTSFKKDICLYLPRCLKCYPYVENKGTSIKEKDIISYIKQIYNGEIIEHDRTIISPYELDIVIPEKKLAIEFDGLYWHSDAVKINKSYHLMKTNKCELLNYQLIHIFENDWDNKQNIIKEKLKYLLGIDQQVIYGRKCIIKEINTKDKNKFLNENHIQGEDKSKVKLGLYYNDQLVSLMTFVKPRFNKKYQWELSRFCSLNGYRVIGGASKLLKYFELNYKPKSLITYADRRFSIGNLYYKLGFTLDHISNPNYFYVKSFTLFNRIQFQKHKLKNLLQNYDNNKTEIENMHDNGYNIIYDCGNYVFIKEYLNNGKINITTKS